MDYNLSMVLVEILHKMLPVRAVKKLQMKLVPIIAKKMHKVEQHLRYVDINVAAHCNLKCKYCANFCPITEEKYLDLQEYDRDLQRLAFLSKGKIKTIRLLGGEPLLHPRLTEVMDSTRRYFPLSKIDLVTNGLLLLKMSEQFWLKCREHGVKVAISHYPIELQYEKIKETAKRHKVKTEYGKKARGMYKWLLDLSGGQDAKESHSFCFRANQCTVLQNGKIYACSLPSWIQYFNKYFGKNLEVSEKDSIDIYQAESFEQIQKFLGNPIPFCKYCNTKEMDYNYQWAVSNKEIEEWT
jgi:sulfatase maturation enzyme AslB (radical SAM superfamily)